MHGGHCSTTLFLKLLKESVHDFVVYFAIFPLKYLGFLKLLFCFFLQSCFSVLKSVRCWLPLLCFILNNRWLSLKYMSLVIDVVIVWFFSNVFFFCLKYCVVENQKSYCKRTWWHTKSNSGQHLQLKFLQLWCYSSDARSLTAWRSMLYL